MPGERPDGARAALRALAAPLSIGSLVVLALNDHLLKQAWPGVVTGKLSDVAGLVVAPLVLAVVLALLGVRRAGPAAVVVTGLAFAWVKSTGLGSDLASAAWSAVAGTSYLRRDPTDLLALPALLVAWMLLRRARRPLPPLRERATAAAGALVLPFALLATAATSPCHGPSEMYYSVGTVEGHWDGSSGRESRLVFTGNFATPITLSSDGQLRAVTAQEELRLDEALDPQSDAVCVPTSDRCWRAGLTDIGVRADLPSVESTKDGGDTWTVDYAMSPEDAARVWDHVGESCGQPVDLWVEDLAVLPTDRGPLVGVAVMGGDLLVRDVEGTWRQHFGSEVLADLPTRAPDPAEGPLERLQPVRPPSPGPTEAPSPPCPSPSLVTPPRPQNSGPASVYEVCA